MAKSQAPIEDGDWHVVAKKKKKKEKSGYEEKGEVPCERSIGYKRPVDFEALLARQVGRRHQGVGDILKKMKAKVNPRKAGLEVLSIRRTRKEEVLLVLKKGGDVSAFRKELDLAVEERAQISALVSSRSLEIRDFDETVDKEEVLDALCSALGRPALDGSCRLCTRFGVVKTAVIRLAEADAALLLQLGKLRIGWVA